MSEATVGNAGVVPAEEKPDKASIVVMSGDLDKVMGSFIIATAAAAAGMEVTMFFTFWGLRALKKNVPTGRTFFGRLLGLMYGGDITRCNPSKFSFCGLGRWMFNRMMKRHNVPDLAELRRMAIDLGVKLYACQMSMDVMEFPREALIDELTDVVGAAFFVSEAAESSFSLFI
ncbi:MAG: DsrE/DsrF/DrsH-like family protein [Bacillota bacterium]|nr:DsrE/DsrF/DrsH-like family protein [Bacillota bacterium]